MKKFLILLCLIFLNINISFAAQTAIGIVSDTIKQSDNGNLDQNSIFGNIGSLNSKKNELSQAESLIGLDTKSIEENTKIITDLNEYYLKSYKILESISYASGDIDKLKSDFIKQYGNVLDLLGEKLDSDFESYKESILNQNTEEKIKVFIRKKQEENKKARTEIEENNTLILTYNKDIVKLEAIIQGQIEQLIYKIFIFVSIIILLLLTRKITNNIITKSTKLADERKIVLLLINKWLINIALALSIFVFFSSEFFSILPFLAIISTAIGFALRDILSNFIAWSIIGLRDSIYKIGDVIEIKDDNIFGRVIDIKVLTTTIQELGLSGPTGKILIFPNKKIFEKSINNIWKMKGYTYIAIDFLMELDSDLDKSKLILKKVMDEVFVSDIGTKITSTKGFAKKYSLNEDAIKPQVFFDIKKEGVMLRGKILVNFLFRHKVRNVIIENFIKESRRDSDIKLKTIDIL